MCLCQICAELLLGFHFVTNFWQVGPPASSFNQIFPVGVDCHLFTFYSANFALMLCAPCLMICLPLSVAID